LIWFSSPLGLAIAGPLSDRFGIQIWYIIAGILCLLLFLAAIFNKTLLGLEDEELHFQNGK